METFTRRGPPSDDIFSGDMALRHWIKSSFPSAIMQVVDSNLLKPEDAGVCDIYDEASIGLH